MTTQQELLLAIVDETSKQFNVNWQPVIANKDQIDINMKYLIVRVKTLSDIIVIDYCTYLTIQNKDSGMFYVKNFNQPWNTCDRESLFRITYFNLADPNSLDSIIKELKNAIDLNELMKMSETKGIENALQNKQKR
jgi:hypothetical protein